VLAVLTPRPFQSEALLPTPVAALATDDIGDILGFLIEAFSAGKAVALATLVEIRGGAARSIGTQMAISSDGRYCGYVSGGCTEAAVAAEALLAINENCDRSVLFGQGAQSFDIILPCGGGLTIAVHPVRHIEPIAAVLAARTSRRATGLRYSPSRQTLTVDDTVAETGWDDEDFVIAYWPSTRLIVCGRTIEAKTTAKLAAVCGYDVIEIDPSHDPRIFAEYIDSYSAVALLCHDLDTEVGILDAALAASPFYLGALGSSRTHASRIDYLTKQGFSRADCDRIKAPIGLFPKARDANALALSVLADVAACLQDRRGNFKFGGYGR
jgi:xanthine dehydrogenase accessory factor